MSKRDRLLKFASGIGWSAFIVAILTLASRLVGLVRVRIFASTFGAGTVLDTYYAAFRIPDLLMGVLIVGTLSIAALPVLSEHLLKQERAGMRLAANLLNVTATAMAAICALAALLAPWLVQLVVPGFGPEQRAEVVLLTRIILLAQVLLSVGNVVATTLNALKKFFWAGFAPITYNLGLIVGVVWLYPRYGLNGLGYGVLLGAIFHVGIQLLDLYIAGFRFQFVFKIDEGLRAILKLYIPRLLTLDLSQVSLLLASVFGSLLSSGSIAVYALGFDIQAVPVGVFALAIATAVFPHLSEQFALNKTQEFVVLLRESVVRVLFFMLPISVWLLLLRAHVVRILYGTGQFSWDDTRATFGVVGVLAFSILGQSVVPLFSRAHLARHNTWAPVAGNLISIVVTVLAAAALVPRYGIAGVAAGYAVAISINALLLYWWLRRELLTTTGAETVVSHEEYVGVQQTWKILLACIALAASTYGTLYAVEPFVNTRTGLGLVIQAGAAVVVGGLVYFFVTAGLRLPDAKGFQQLFRKRFQL